MSERGVRRFVADLLRGRRPRRFRVDSDDEAAELRAAITLRAARPGGGAPREEFVTALHRRLATELATDDGADRPGPPAGHSRRRLIQVGAVAAGAAAVGGGVDHVLTEGRAGPGAPETLTPTSGQWRTVMASADLPEGGARGFDLGSVIGFVTRGGGRLGAVSGVCTHLGCRLALNAQAARLDCPCHNTSFALGGQLLRHELPTAPRPLPHLRVREVDGAVQVFAPAARA